MNTNLLQTRGLFTQVLFRVINLYFPPKIPKVDGYRTVWQYFKERLQKRVCLNPHRAMASLVSICLEMESECGHWLFHSDPVLGAQMWQVAGGRLGCSAKGVRFPKAFLEDYTCILY